MTASASVQRGLFYLQKGDVWSFIFFFAPAAITHSMFSSSKRAGGIGTQSGLKGLGSQKPKEDFFFFGTLDFLWNYINSGAFKSVFRRQKGGKL